MACVITARPGETFQALQDRLATISDVYSAASVLASARQRTYRTLHLDSVLFALLDDLL